MTPRPFDIELHVRRHGEALRSLARELLRDRSAVEDALQETWLRAMRSPPREQAGLGAWFAAILRNVGRRTRRGEARRLHRETVVARPDLVEDHVVVLAREEMATRLLAAVTALQQPYRDAVWARYFEGKAPREIAAASGAPLATVKSRLQRGLGMLREQLGDEGSDWRGALAAAFGAGEGGATVAAAGTAGVGGLLMTTGLKVMAVGVAAVIAAVLWWPATATLPPAEQAAGELRTVAAAGAVSPGTQQPQQRETVQQLPAAIPLAVSGPTPAPEPGIVSGRAIDAVTKEPLAAVQVRLNRTPADEVVPVVATGADGRFELSARVGRKTWFFLRRDDRVTVEWGGEVAAGNNEDIGDVPMRRGRVLRGRVVDEAGGVVPAEILVTIAFEALFSRLLRERCGDAHTDAAGTFVVGEPVALGTTTWKLPLGPFELTAPVQIDVGETQPEEVVLVARQRARIRGIVVDEAGQPVVDVGLADQPTPVGPVRTGADGRFVMLRMRPGNAASTTVFVAETPGCEPHAPIADVAWGTEDLRIVLRRTRPFRVEVADADGAPVEAFGIALNRPGLPAFGIGNVHQRGQHAGGKVGIQQVVQGKTFLRVLPMDPWLAPSEPIAVGEVEPLRVVLARRVPFAVLVHVHGVPVAAVLVELVRERGVTPLAFDPRVTDTTSSERVWMYGNGAELLAAATTSESGLVSLRRDVDLTGCILRLQVAGQPAAIVRDLIAPRDGSPLRVELPGHGSIVGRVELRGRDPSTLRIEIPSAQRSGGRAIGLSPDGSFAVPELQAGTYGMTLSMVGSGGIGAIVGSSREVEVAAGEPTQVAFDLGDYPLARVRGTVTSDVALPNGLAVDFLREHDDLPRQVLGFAVVAVDGTFVVADLLPGTYRVGYRTSQSMQTSVPGWQGETFVFVGGEEERLPLRYSPRRLVVNLRRPDGGIVRSERVVTRCAGATWPAVVMLTPVVDEKVVLDPAPMLPIEFRGWNAGESWSAAVAMPNDRAEAEVTVVLPDPPR
ncbi:MAG TPA: RNA polymerase sigma factor [Planctomycetota bacterium]|nr:RNA polymerase sigma factor [Planctomycetota bacterium]